MKEIEGNLIEMTLKGNFDIIAHGCNCFCTMNSGIAKALRETWSGVYDADCETVSGDYNKLGTMTKYYTAVPYDEKDEKPIEILNCYTQYRYGRDKVYVDYDAITMCMNKIAHEYKDKKIGLPMIGCGLAGGDWNIVRTIIMSRLKGMDVTIVKLKQ